MRRVTGKIQSQSKPRAKSNNLMAESGVVVKKLSRVESGGGCYAVLVEQFLADRYLPDPDALNGTVLALETSELIPDSAVVGANLRALGERGLLERFDGVLVGRAAARSHVEKNSQEWRVGYRERQRDTIADVLETYNPNAPVVFNCEFGHTYPTCPIPIGGEVEIEPSTKSIRFP